MLRAPCRASNAIVIAPSVVSSTARCCASCSGVSFANGTGSGGGVSRIVTAVIATRVSRRALRVGRELRDLLDDVEPFADAAEHGELPRQRRLIGDAHEELRAAAVRLPGPQRRADRAARERLRAVLRLQHAEPAASRPAPLFAGSFDSGSPPWMMPCRTTRWNGVFAYAPSPRQLHEVADVIRRQIRPQIDDERARRGLDHRLLARHLRGRQRRLERTSRPPARCAWRAAQRCSGRADSNAIEDRSRPACIS